MFAGFKDEKVTLNSGLKLRARIGGSGPAVLLLHGYPQTSACWHLVAPKLVDAGYTVVASDLRGYGQSDKPVSSPGHSTYSKRAMASDQIELMSMLGHDGFHLVGHDRGGRVAHRAALDHPNVIQKLAILDIVPTATMYRMTDKDFATAYYHWFFLIQPSPIPEILIGADAGFYLDSLLNAWGRSGNDVFHQDAYQEYVDAFASPNCVSATCEDYRAAATIDLEHDAHDAAKKITSPLLILWGANGLIGTTYDVLDLWRQKAEDVSGEAFQCGHFIPEEAPKKTAQALISFLGS